MTDEQKRSLWWRLVAFGFRLLYNELAWTYDMVSWSVSLGHWRKWQQASIKHLYRDGSHPVLEVAHGTADLQMDMISQGIKAIGLDLSPYMGKIAARKLRLAGHVPRLTRASADSLPFPDQSFTSIVSTFPTEFILQSKTLREVMRTLVPGGRLVFVPNGMLKLTNPIARILEWLYRITGQRGPWPIDPLEAFREAGFTANMIVEELAGSQVWIIVAEKPA